MTPKKLLLGELVFLKWIDSRGKGGWQKPSDGPAVGMIYSVGWVVSADDTFLTITTSLQADNSYGYDPLSIPWVSIKALSV